MMYTQNTDAMEDKKTQNVIPIPLEIRILVAPLAGKLALKFPVGA